MKKFWAILLAMMLVLSMVTVAGASEVTEGDTPTATGFTITVNPKDDVDHEYQVYQIFTADVVADESGAKVLTSVKWGANAKNDTAAVRTGDPVPDAVLEALKTVSGTNQEKLAEITKYWYADSTPVDTFSSTKAAPGKSKKLTPGYYLVRDNQAKLEGKDGAVCKVITDKRELPAQLVIFAAGFLPNGQLAKDAGLEVAPFGAIVVNEKMQTSDPDIYAGGDCVAIKNLITGKLGYLPLGSMANRQGRVIGTNLAGGDASFPGFVGTWAVKLFDMSFCGAGLTVERARKEGYDAISVAVEQLDRAHFYPEKNMMSLELVVDKSDRRVLGIQGACTAGDALKARIDAVAAVLQYGKPTVEDISNLEISYAPPFASAMDVVNVVANVADNVLAGRVKPITSEEFMALWEKRAENNIFFIDARPAKAGQAVQAVHPEWHSISLEEMPSRVNEVPKDRPVAIICNTGLRAYDSVLILARNGITDVVNAAGGMQAVLKTGGKI